MRKKNRLNMKVLNLYAGLGGNRKLWKDVEVTAVESNVEIARVYQEQNPDDIVIIGDAHDYLLKNANNFEFIWSSPPCQSHSRMIRSGRNRRPRYPDLKLYEEIIHLQYDYNGKWVVENVLPYYQPLIPYTVKVGRHLFWSNFDFEVEPVKSPKNLLSGGKKQARKEELMEWLDIYYEENIYYDGNHCPSQVLRNCVHPKIGQQIFEQIELNMASDNDEETKRKRDFQNWAKTGIMPNSQKNDFWTPQQNHLTPFHNKIMHRSWILKKISTKTMPLISGHHGTKIPLGNGYRKRTPDLTP
mgnify:CR=1 FL=1